MARNNDEEVISIDSTEDIGTDPRVYELGFHLDPELPVEEVKKVYQALRTGIEGKGTIVAEVEPEKIPLAYTISRQDVAGRRDFDSAYFGWIVYEATPLNHAEVIAAADSDKYVIRFIDLITTKDAARHALEMKEISMKMPEKEDDTEETAGAELDAALESVAI
ncbi:MAG: hypothetical protein JWN18_677 [Parcubacteria group bacterium]|nr:hypothetical protein [Parcubacteria group bacterium]